MTRKVVPAGGLLTRPPFSTLFAINPKDREAVQKDMRANGFDESQALAVWNDGEGLVVVDGHTRLDVARELGLTSVPVFIHPFKDQLDAIEYAIHLQRDRRNWTNEEIVNAVKVYDEEYLKPEGGNNNPYGRSGRPDGITSSDLPVITGPSRSIVAEKTGLGEWTVSAARSVYRDPIAMAEVKSGVSISAAAERARQRKKAETAQSTNGHTSEPLPGAQTDWTKKAHQSRRDDEPWFKAMDHGAICQAICRRAASDIRLRLEMMAEQGLDLVSFMNEDSKENARVRAEWNRALDEARTVSRLIRRTIQAAKVDGDE